MNSEVRYDFICFCETRLLAGIERMFKLQGFNMVTNNRNTHGGGVMIYIRDCYTFNLIEEISLMKDSSESVFIKVSIEGGDYIMGLLLCISWPRNTVFR